MAEGWSPDDAETIAVGDRRMRVRRRRQAKIRPLVATAVAAALIAAGLGAYFWFKRPSGLAALPGPAVVAAGAFQAKVGPDQTITVALEIRNTTDVAVTVLRARINAPTGLTQTALSLLPPGEQNKNLGLGGDLPPAAPVDLGTKRRPQRHHRGPVQGRREQLPSTDGPTGSRSSSRYGWARISGRRN